MTRLNLNLSDELLKVIDEHIKLRCISNRTAFIEQALRSYLNMPSIHDKGG